MAAGVSRVPARSLSRSPLARPDPSPGPARRPRPSAHYLQPQCSVAHTHPWPVQNQRPGIQTGSQAVDGMTTVGTKMMEWGWRNALKWLK